MQHLRQLIGRRRARDLDSAFVVEGAKAVGEALDARAPLLAVFAAPDAPSELVERAAGAGAVVHRLDGGVIERVAPTTTPQPLLAVVEQTHVALESLSAASLLVVAVDLADPGNLGTVMRSAEAAGADGVVCCGSHVDIYNPKTVRAAAGSLFYLPVVRGGDAAPVLETLGEWGMRRFAAAARGGRSYTDVDLQGPIALVLGNESAGLSASVVAKAVDEVVTIPMAGRSESLNVGMAAAILCFEAARQRREGRAGPDER